MLGRVMSTFDDETLGRFLTTKMGAGLLSVEEGNTGVCFWRIANADGCWTSRIPAPIPDRVMYRDCAAFSGTGLWYDYLCKRFGTARVAQAIRNRALTLLASRRSPAPVVASQESRETVNPVGGAS